LAQKPLLAVFHPMSSAVNVLLETRAGEVVLLEDGADSKRLSRVMEQILAQLPYVPAVDWDAFEQYTAREMTRQQCELFNQVVGPNGSRYLVNPFRREDKVF
jgi:hypothetical protein